MREVNRANKLKAIERLADSTDADDLIVHNTAALFPAAPVHSSVLTATFGREMGVFDMATYSGNSRGGCSDRVRFGLA